MPFVMLVIWSSWKTWITAPVLKGCLGNICLMLLLVNSEASLSMCAGSEGKFFAEVDARGTSQSVLSVVVKSKKT
jgi:hypothetical protein